MPATIAGTHLGPDVHANRPAANAAGQPIGALYSCTTHGVIYKTDGSTWSTYATLGGGGTLSDQGVITYLDGTVAAAPGTPAAGKLRIYAKTGKVLAVKDDAGVETVLGAGGGSDLVQTSPGAGSVYIPGLRGAADVKPASPSAFDDEFEALSGWTVLGTLDTSSVSDVPSHWHAKRTLAAIGVDGIFKTAPSMPFTVTARLSGSNISFGANYNMAGILLTEASPGKVCTFGLVSNGATQFASLYRWTNRSTFSSNSDFSTARGTGTPIWRYIRLVVNSSSSVDGYLSDEGIYWTNVGLVGGTTGLTVANVGLCIGDAAAAGSVEAYFDWIRFS